MDRFSHAVSFGLALLGLAACGGGAAPDPSRTGAPVTPHEDCTRIVQRYWDERGPAGNPLAPQFLADSLAVERRFLADVIAVPVSGLDAGARLTYDIFKRQRQLAIEGFTYPAELTPVNPFEGMPWQFALAAAGLGQRPLAGAKDYEEWLAQIDGYVGWTHQAIANMREGMRRGYTSPRVLMQRTLPLLQSLGTDTSANIFYQTLQSMPESIKEPERTRLTSSLNGAIRDKLLPAYRELHEFIQNEYLPRARTSIALTALPLGPSWYAYRIKRATDTQLTPGEIHNMGVAEVERIRTRLLSLPASADAGAGARTAESAAGAAGAKGGANAGADIGTGAPAGTGEPLKAYQDLKAQAV